MAEKPQIVTLRGKTFFVCEYTGVFIKKRFFIPFGNKNKKKRGCYATLPILFRALHEELDNFPEAFEVEKKRIMAFYEQPNVPVAPALEDTVIPLDSDEFKTYLEEIEMGSAWLKIRKGQTMEDYLSSQKSKHKRVKRDGCV
jgi:hypothetical protein